MDNLGVKFPRRYYSPIDSGGGSKDTVPGEQGDPKPQDQQQTDPPQTPPAPEVVTYTPEQQKHIDKLLASARDEGRTAGKTQAEMDAQRRQAQESGDKDAQIKLLDGDKQTLQRQVDDLTQKLERRDDETVRLRVAAKHKLPEGWHSRLVGKNEAEYDADAREMAKQIAPPKPADLEPGTRGKSSKEEQRKAAEARASRSGRYQSA